MGRTLSDIMVLDFFDLDSEMETESGEIEWRSDDDDEGDDVSVTETKAFWELQHQLLKDALALSRRCSTETRIQRDTEEVIRKIRSQPHRNCLLQDVLDGLRDLGYNSALCKSKWRTSPDIPSGEHSYIDIINDVKNTKSGRKPIRAIIELNFRSEFEMARASSDYNSLIANLPEIFVGKPDRMRNVIRIMCDAAKKCMKDNKMHMAPWRKHKYMESKWLGTCERVMPSMLFPVEAVVNRPLRPRASMLTFDLHCPAMLVA